jgi:hypothetical protein
MMSRADYVKLDDFIAEFEWTRSRHGGLVSNAAKIFDSNPRTICGRLERARSKGINVEYYDDTRSKRVG